MSLKTLIFVSVLFASLGLAQDVYAQIPQEYTVNSVEDLPDGNLNDALCRAGVNDPNSCTLRAAIEQLTFNFFSIRDPNAIMKIHFNLGTNGNPIVLDFNRGPLLLAVNLIIEGNARNADRELVTIISGNDQQRILQTTHVFDIIPRLHLRNLRLTAGRADDGLGGGALLNTQRIEEIRNCDFDLNESSSVGGAINNQGSIGTIRRSQFNNNIAQDHGGALHNNADHVIESIVESSFSDNRVRDGSGGAIYVDGASRLDHLRRSLFTGNRSERNASNFGGGALYFGEGNHPYRVINSTFTDNTSAFDGGAIYTNSPLLSVFFSTIYNNRASRGGGIYSANIDGDTFPLLRGSILSGNISPAGAECSGRLTVGGQHNFLGNVSGCSLDNTEGNLVGYPFAAELSNQGGLTRVLVPSAGSSAINYVSREQCTDHMNQPLLSDQRGTLFVGEVRKNGPCDVGAFESSCGNGELEESEECDDGNTDNDDGCDRNCTETRCGNEIINEGELCDLGAFNSDETNAVCRLDCQERRCGDGVVDEFFQEQCDAGPLNGNADAACDEACKLPVCGDGTHNTHADFLEECDDGNGANEDGCSAQCTIEEGFTCEDDDRKHSQCSDNFLVEIRVTTPHDVLDPNDGLCSLREAVIAANKNQASGPVDGECPAGRGTDTIVIPALESGQVYSVSLPREDLVHDSFRDDINIQSSMNIQGEGRETTVIDGGGVFPIFVVTPVNADEEINVSLRGLTLQNGNASHPDDFNGGAVMNGMGSHLLVEDIVLQNNQARQGGAIANLGQLTVIGSQFINNETSFPDQPNSSGGGAIYSQGALSIEGSHLENNHARTGWGGAIEQKGDYLSILGPTAFVANEAERSGGAIDISGNAAVQINSARFESNRAGLIGGALAFGNKTLIHIDKSLFVENQAANRGGALHAFNLRGQIQKTAFIRNTAGARGGALSLEGNGDPGEDLLITNVTIAQNTAIRDGGGIYHGNNAPRLRLVHATISENVAGNENNLTFGGGFYTDGALENTVLQSSVVAGNTVFNIENFLAPDCAGRITSLGHNFVGNNRRSGFPGCEGFGATDRIAYTDTEVGILDPQLRPLGDYGGETLSYLLAAGSPLQNVIENAQCARNVDGNLLSDQRGAARPLPIDGACDIGAVEVGCGDFFIDGETGEICDDGNTASGDGCSATCQPEEDFTCEGQTTSVCRADSCGNGTFDANFNETCDDGNLDNGDGCDAQCQTENGFACNQDSPSVCAAGNVPPPPNPPAATGGCALIP